MTEVENSLWALFYENEAYAIDGERIMGRQAAGNSLLRAYAYSDHKNVGVYARNKDCFDDFTSDFSSLLKNDVKKKLSYIPWGNPSGLSIFGGLYYPAPDISRFVNQRYFYNATRFSKNINNLCNFFVRSFLTIPRWHLNGHSVITVILK